MPSYVDVTVTLVLMYSAYIDEVLRAGIERCIHTAADGAIFGLSYNQRRRVVVLPQAVRKVTPALMNDFVWMQKDVGLISVLGAVDALRAAQSEVAQTLNFTRYVVAGLLFVLLSWPTIWLTEGFVERDRRREQIGALL